MKHLPNIFTSLRILCTPILVILLLLSGNNHSYAWWAFGIFTFASTTDWVDGFLARALDAKSELGAKLDLWADKLLVGLTIIGIGIAEIVNGQYSLILIILLTVFMIISTSVRDYIVTDLRAKGQKFGLSMPATFLAKAKTAVIMIGLAVYLGGISLQNDIIIITGIIITIIGGIMSLYTGMQYLNAYNKARDIAK